MTNVTRRAFLASGAAAAALCLGGCASTSGTSSSSAARSSASQAGASANGKHIIGVIVYNVSDSEVLMFREYLVNYIAATAFSDVQFIYSGGISDEEQLLAFIDDVAALGAEGIMSFYNIDLQAEVARCAEHGMYHMVASGTVSDEDFAKVAENDHFLGCIGPGIEMEYNAGAAMVRNYIAKKTGDRYFIMSGGAALGNEMHYERTLGMLDTLETSYGVDLGQTKELAKVDKATTVEVGDVFITISPGYPAREGMKEPIVEAFKASTYDVVLSALPVAPVSAALYESSAKIAQVDCYSQENQLLFAVDKLSYLAGKYGSLVGPSFAAMYNAIGGYAADFRDDGKAFRIVQNFWASDSKADFDEKYEFASNITTPAYNYEDLQSICKAFTPGATFADLKKLAEASSYEDAKKRRSIT
ncbi:MAG: hypothetical protein J6S36_05435 [Eggerthellaceae bacterium]|nr:hypothetical protein [Eggerthellaceae bacterium]